MGRPNVTDTLLTLVDRADTVHITFGRVILTLNHLVVQLLGLLESGCYVLYSGKIR